MSQVITEKWQLTHTISFKTYSNNLFYSQLWKQYVKWPVLISLLWKKIVFRYFLSEIVCIFYFWSGRFCYFSIFCTTVVDTSYFEKMYLLFSSALAPKQHVKAKWTVIGYGVLVSQLISYRLNGQFLDKISFRLAQTLCCKSEVWLCSPILFRWVSLVQNKMQAWPDYADSQIYMELI